MSTVEHHEQPVVLVVRVGGRHHEDAGVGQVPQGQSERRVPVLFVHRHDHHLCAWKEPHDRHETGDERKTTKLFGHNVSEYTAGGILENVR